MRRLRYEIDLDAGKEFMSADGLNLKEILGVTLRPITVMHDKLYKTRPDLASVFRMRVCQLILDPNSPVWQDRETSGPDDIFTIIDTSKIGGGS